MTVYCEGGCVWSKLVWVSQVRALAVTAALVLAARGTGLLPAQAAATVHLVSWASLLGANVWTTFFAGVTMFKNLPRQVFGRLQVNSPLWDLMERTPWNELMVSLSSRSDSGSMICQTRCLGIEFSYEAFLHLSCNQPLPSTLRFDRGQTAHVLSAIVQLLRVRLQPSGSTVYYLFCTERCLYIPRSTTLSTSNCCCRL